MDDIDAHLPQDSSFDAYLAQQRLKEQWDETVEQYEQTINNDRLLGDPLVNEMLPLLVQLFERPGFWAFIMHLLTVAQLEATLHRKGTPTPEELAITFGRITSSLIEQLNQSDELTDFPTEVGNV